MITLAITYYECPKMLIEQIKYWKGYKFKDFEIILVDDGSSKYPAEQILKNEDFPINVRVFHIKQDFHNVGGARNLAFEKAKDGWIINTDIDHIFPYESLSNLLSKELNSKRYYTFKRFEMTEFGSKEIHSHEGTFMITREAFKRLGGFDERFSKYYYEGAIFMYRKAMKSQFKSDKLKDVWTIWYSPYLIPDASPLMNADKLRLTGSERKRILDTEKRVFLNFDYIQVL